MRTNNLMITTVEMLDGQIKWNAQLVLDKFKVSNGLHGKLHIQQISVRR